MAAIRTFVREVAAFFAIAGMIFGCIVKASTAMGVIHG
ncbi:hypothetical protein AB7M45_007878 [Bradyrhizobium elkanii]|nr:hypothetical protein [Bradyrhizobium elkanii]